MDTIFIDDLSLKFRNTVVIEQKYTQEKNDADWFYRRRMDAEECILLLYDAEKYSEASKKLEHILSKDLPDLESIVLLLLKAINTTGHAKNLFRKGIYEILRKQIWEIRSEPINLLLNEIIHTIDSLENNNEIAELETCYAILTLIPEDHETSTDLKKNLHHEVTSKTPAKMVSLILQTYKNMKFFWKKVWFPHVIHIEELAEKIFLEKKGLSEIKKYAYMHHHIDWKIMNIFFQRMLPIINNAYDEDLRDNAYWSRMQAKNTIKLSGFADPTPIMTRNGYMPILCEKGRYSAVNFLMGIILKENQDADIVQDALEHLATFEKGECSSKIKKLYVDFNASYLITLQKVPDQKAVLQKPCTSHIPLSDPEKILKLKKMIAIFPTHLIPEEIINTVAKKLDVNCGIDEIFSITHGLLLKNQEWIKTIQILPQEEDLLSVELLAILKEKFHCSSQDIDPISHTNNWAHYTDLMLKKITHNFKKPLHDELVQILHDLHFFFKKTHSNPHNTSLYENVLQQHFSALKDLSSLKLSKYSASLDDPIYHAYFNLWKKHHNIESIQIQHYELTEDGAYTFTFNVIGINNLNTLIKTRYHHHHIMIEILEKSSDTFDEEIRQIRLPLNKNASIKVYETIDRMNYKEYADEKDIFQLIHFFETVLIREKPQLESISISAIFFTTLFGFSKNNGNIGIPQPEDLNYILKKKLFLSFLSEVCGKNYAEKVYKKDIEDALKNKSIVLIPYSPILPETPYHLQKVVHFYNLAITFSKNDSPELLIQAFSAVLGNIHSMENGRMILYECSLVLQKIFSVDNMSYYFTPFRAAFYLRKLQETLFKVNILDLKCLIHTILSRVSLNDTHHHSIVSLIDIINACNILIPYIYTNEELIQTDFKLIQSSFNKVIKLANIAVKHVGILADIPLLQKLCDLYIISHHLGYDWWNFKTVLPEILSTLLNESSIKNSISALDILMNSAIKFFILKGTHSDLFINEISAYIVDMLSLYKTDQFFLFSIRKRILPISPILWPTDAFRFFHQMISAIVDHLHQKKPTDISSYIDFLNSACRIKNSLKLNIISPEINVLYNNISDIFMEWSDELIKDHLIPLWKNAHSLESRKEIEIILGGLSLEVQENEDFLRKIEDHYQKTVTNNIKNEIDLFQVLKSMWRRYNTPPTYKTLRPYLFKSYLTNGDLFEEKWGYDALSEILNMPRGLITYLRLEDQKRNFLTALVTPIYMDNKQKVTGFGAGGKMKMKINQHGHPNNPLMPIVNVTDLTQSKFGKILEIMTFKESYYYWQRMFNPILCEGRLVTGTFRVLYLDDNSIHFGGITNADGCGFINAKILGNLYGNICKQPPHSSRIPVQTHQAIHYNKKSVDEELFQNAIDEIVLDSSEAIEEYLSRSRHDQPSVRDLFSLITTGGIKNGRNFIVIPAAGQETFIIPLSLGNSDVCLGKTPYEKLNDIVLKQEHELCHLKSSDLQKRRNALHLASLCGFQHSFIATDGNKLLFNKGILVIIPEKEWIHEEADIIFCKKDQKVNSTWNNAKKLPEHNEKETVNGVLSVIQQYGPGSFAAISSDQQIDVFNADFDGDGVSVNIKPKGTHTFQLMRKTNALFTPYSTPKSVKSFTSSFSPDGQYRLFKFEYIMQARTANLLSFYSKIFDIYIALNHHYQRVVAKSIANMGILNKIIKHILIDDSIEVLQEQLDEKPHILIQRVLSAGIKSSSDAFKSKVDWTYLREFGKILDTIYDKLDIPKDLAYFKKLSIDMHTQRVDFEEIIADAKYQNKFFDSLPLHILHKTLSNTPKYKLDRLSSLLESQRNSNYAMQYIQDDPQKKTNQNVMSYSHRIENVSFVNDLKNMHDDSQKYPAHKWHSSVEPAFLIKDALDKASPLPQNETNVIDIFSNDQECALSKTVSSYIKEDMASSKIIAQEIIKEEGIQSNNNLKQTPLFSLSHENESNIVINSGPLYIDILKYHNEMRQMNKLFASKTVQVKQVTFSEIDRLSIQIKNDTYLKEIKNKVVKSSAFWRSLFRLKR